VADAAGPAYDRGMYQVQRLLWDVRKDPEISSRFLADPERVLDDYGVHGQDRIDLQRRDFKSLYDRGTNPYLLYFWALQIGVDRADYYADLRRKGNS
jgi:hypothetical protein